MTAADYALYATVVITWGAAWLPLRLQLGVVSPEVSAVWRFLLGGLIVFGWLIAAKGRVRFPLSDHLRFAVLGLTMFSFNFLSAYYAGFHLNGGLLAIIFSLTAVINPLYAALLGRGGLNLRVVAGAVIGVIGVALLFGPKLLSVDAQPGTLAGVLLMLFSVFIFATGNMFSAAFQARGLPVLSANAWSMLYGTAFLALFALLRGQPFIVEWTPKYVLSLLWLAVAGTAIGFFAYVTLIGRIGTGRTGYVTVLMPLVALALSTLFEGYSWTVWALIGVALVLIGNAIVLSAPAKAET
ncbi:MAG: DMT family transporter [Xanthobacteraceae bacterium]|nr:DMT family transporter [Xanthobacteraceae bacterium]MCW5678518.1 DMT family transporter [Xanthobacteraceae bacterium]